MEMQKKIRSIRKIRGYHKNNELGGSPLQNVEVYNCCFEPAYTMEHIFFCLPQIALMNTDVFESWTSDFGLSPWRLRKKNVNLRQVY